MTERELTEAEIAANIAKTAAETRNADAEAEAATLSAHSNAAKTKAEARKLKAEARVAEVQLHEEEAHLVKVRYDADREREKRDEELATDKHHKVYLFDKDVNDTSVKACIHQLSTWERTSSEPITVEMVINSPGGSVIDGFALIDFINVFHERGGTVNTTAYGMAASMGGVLLQAGKKRFMGANSVLLIHEAQFGAVGSYGEVEDRVKLVNIFHDRILSIFAARAHVTKAFIKRNWNRRDWWLDAETSLKHGFIDEVR